MLGMRACLSSDSLYSVGALSRVAMEAFAWGAWIWEAASHRVVEIEVVGGVHL